jgi:flavin reductase (DIM6/NTAB) family NADH-FMN oxidoreductase RutF
MITIEPNTITPKERYKILTGSVVPRPIALVSTINKLGEANLAPFSFFTVACYNPMIFAFFPIRFKKEREFKDTVTNLRITGECVINIVTKEMIESVNKTSGLYEYEVDEFEISGLTPLKSEVVTPFRVKESPVQYECVLNKEVNFGEEVGGANGMFVEVKKIHVREDLIEEYRIDYKTMNPAARLAGGEWSLLGEIVNLGRPAD